ncbi:MAG: hypothetical protein OQK78_03695 [Gammaproteobacteria bacterium]|nr:hypothetical protein [Gammaproteobacteria bacterium]
MDSFATACDKDALLNELDDVLHMLDDELYALSHSPLNGLEIPVLKNPVDKDATLQGQLPLLGEDARSIKMEESEVETLVDLLIERQLPKLRAELRQSILNEVHRILPNK